MEVLSLHGERRCMHLNSGNRKISVDSGVSHLGDFPLREDGSSMISPFMSSTEERRTSYPFKVKPFVEKSFEDFTDREMSSVT